MVYAIEEKARNIKGAMGDALRTALKAQREELYELGINYELDGINYCDKAYNPLPLLDAYKTFLDSWPRPQYFGEPHERASIPSLEKWLDIGKQQRLMPAHAIQEMLTPQRCFFPYPIFQEKSLIRTFDVLYYGTCETQPAFPLQNLNQAELGTNYTIIRSRSEKHGLRWDRVSQEEHRIDIEIDLAALETLFIIRKNELTRDPDLTLKAEVVSASKSSASCILC
jgi:hypothetical protein